MMKFLLSFQDYASLLVALFDLVLIIEEGDIMFCSLGFVGHSLQLSSSFSSLNQHFLTFLATKYGGSSPSAVPNPQRKLSN